MNSIFGFGERLKSSIKSSNLTQEEVGKEIGVSKNTMTNYIKEKKYPSIDKLCELSNSIGVDICWLLTGKKNIELSADEIIFIESYRKGIGSKDSSNIKSSSCPNSEDVKLNKGSA